MNGETHTPADAAVNRESGAPTLQGLHPATADDSAVPPTLQISRLASNLVPPGVEPFPAVTGYEVFRVLGRGGMGVVYEARHLRLNRPTALNMILGGRHHDPRLTVCLETVG